VCDDHVGSCGVLGFADLEKSILFSSMPQTCLFCSDKCLYFCVCLHFTLKPAFCVCVCCLVQRKCPAVCTREYRSTCCQGGCQQLLSKGRFLYILIFPKCLLSQSFSSSHKLMFCVKANTNIKMQRLSNIAK